MLVVLTGRLTRCSSGALEHVLQRTKLTANVTTNATLEGPTQDVRQLLPLEFAHLREPRSGRGRLKAVLDVKDRRVVFLPHRQTRRRIKLKLLEGELRRRAKRNRLVDNAPPARTGLLDRLDLAAPARIVHRVDDELPDLLRR